MTDIKQAKILIIATDGFEETELTVPQAKLSEAGAKVTIAAPKSRQSEGTIRSWDKTDWGKDVKVDADIESLDASGFDALVLPGGQINPDKLRLEPKALEIIKGFLTILAQTYDPHSEYMSRSELENFKINMALALVGIGAVLHSEDGYAKISELVPGGPASKEGHLKVGDRILLSPVHDIHPNPADGRPLGEPSVALTQERLDPAHANSVSDGSSTSSRPFQTNRVVVTASSSSAPAASAWIAMPATSG